MNLLTKYISKTDMHLIKKKEIPSFIKPMLATLTEDYFSDPAWLFERKLDGERCLLFKKGSTITLKSRNNKILNQSYPEIALAAESLITPLSIILDGEIVAFAGTVTSFSKLQGRFGVEDPQKIQHAVKVYFYIFDIPYYDGFDITHLPLITRKKILKEAITFKNPLRFTEHRLKEGLPYFKQACKKKWEGIIAKKQDSLYEQRRSRNWLKFKCSNEQEFIIVGYTDPQGSRTGFGALLLGYYQNDVLHYAGKVGTGFNEELLISLKKILLRYASTKNYLTDYDDSFNNVHWVKPHIVCQIGFTEWTTVHKLRHPRFLGLRRDKSPKDVHRES